MTVGISYTVGFIAYRVNNGGLLLPVPGTGVVRGVRKAEPWYTRGEP